MQMRSRTIAACLRVIDGDTILCNLTCPCCKIISQQRVRLARIQAPELKSDNHAQALAAKKYLAAFIQGQMIEVLVTRAWPDRYGRVLGEVYYRNQNMSDIMLEAKHAVEWHPATPRTFNDYLDQVKEGTAD